MPKNTPSQPIFLVCIAFLLIFCLSAGCSGDSDSPTATVDAAPASSGGQPAGGISPGETVRIGAFNIQDFSTTKASKPEVMDTLAEIIRTYDVVAIQEILDSSGMAIRELTVSKVNSDGSDYDYFVSKPLGRTSSKEQYAFIYDTTKVVLSDPCIYPEPAGTDPFHREPYLVKMDAGDLDAVLVVIRTDPDEATREINALSDVIAYAGTRYGGERRVVVMGDFNADAPYFNEDGPCSLKSGDYVWLIDNGLDTTTRLTGRTYDRIVITGDMEPYFTGEAGVYRFDMAYGLTDEETRAVSDHYPVYAVFSTGGAL